ncbi:hypothetical protein [Corallococcus macrosporus]|uniref:Uncharacterized protein n=2 Tax=Myxococcaceae TaxID=31 RepID=A0A250JQ45_9BACT|nr:hypothetical protein [Corallococcus macrosporus]AEI62305.1 hypothetical protein LILAB_01890 [Corallococcus macrosporus]ATB45788.1 hypothetical protein MYMAC_001373 [Corallococcus macrosporus DSM 14697]
MAYDGELVKMENGRWARFQRCQVYRPGVEDAGETMLLIAVELEERFQRQLDAAADSLAQYRYQGVPVQVRFDADAQGITLQPEQSVSAPAVH